MDKSNRKRGILSQMFRRVTLRCNIMAKRILMVRPKKAVIIIILLTIALFAIIRTPTHRYDDISEGKLHNSRSKGLERMQNEAIFPGLLKMRENLNRYTNEEKGSTAEEEMGQERINDEGARDLEDTKLADSASNFDNLLGTNVKETDEDEYIIYEPDYISSFQRFSVGQAKIKFLKEFQSPCWLENTTDDHPYKKSNLMQPGIKYKKKNCFVEGLRDKSHAVFIKLPKLDRPYRLRCLPYFMYIGFAKCGSTDFQFRAVINRFMVKGFTKEFYWWDTFRFTANASLSDYSDILDSSLENLLRLKDPTDDFYPGVTGEMTTITMNNMAFWRDDPRNAGLNEPRYLTPHDVYGLIPSVKLIVMLRNPISRLYSHYNMWSPYRHHPVTPEDFHKRVVASLDWWHNCTKVMPVRGCLYGSPPGLPPVEWELSSWWQEQAWHSGEIRVGLYYLFLQDWLQVLPRKQFLILQTEEYGEHKTDTLNHQVYPFLNIPTVTDPNEKIKLESNKEAFKQSYEPMLNETKKLLHAFYQPYNDKLAELLGDEKWSWRDTAE